MVKRSAGKPRFRNSARTATGSVAKRIAPRRSAPLQPIPAAIVIPATASAVRATPGTARKTTANATLRNAAASRSQALSKIRAGRKIPSTAGVSATAMWCGNIPPTAIPTSTVVAAGGKPACLKVGATANATPTTIRTTSAPSSDIPFVFGLRRLRVPRQRSRALALTSSVRRIAPWRKLCYSALRMRFERRATWATAALAAFVVLGSFGAAAAANSSFEQSPTPAPTAPPVPVGKVNFNAVGTVTQIFTNGVNATGSLDTLSGADRASRSNVSNLSVLVSKPNGDFRFGVMAGLYSIPVVGFAGNKTADPNAN